MLVWNDIISPEEILINIRNSSAFITKCTITIFIYTRQRSYLIKCKVSLAIATIFLLHTEALVPIYHLSLPDNRDFCFQSSAHPSFNIYTHLLDYINTNVVICNNSNRHIRLPKKQKLGIVTEIFFQNCFSTKLEANIAKTPPTKLVFRDCTGVNIFAPDLLRKTRLSNSIRVYGVTNVVTQISRLVNEFPSIWE